MVQRSIGQGAAAPKPGAAFAGARRVKDLAHGYLSAEGMTWITLVSCLMLQRMAVPAGGDLKVSLATPIVLAAAGWALLSGSLVFERGRTALFFGLLATGFIATAVQKEVPLAIAPRTSTTSLIYWLAITGLAALRFRRPMPERQFFKIVALCLQIVAVAGIVQFFAQFAHLSVFSFAGIVPDRFLIEEQYAVVIPMDYGFKSNGFFLIEPSVFSQIMALAIIIEAQFFRRPVWLAVFFVGLLVSVSGTGWLVLGTYIVVLAVGAGRRGLLGAILMVAGCAIAFTGLSLVAPGVADSMSGRLTEFTLPGTSGNERFVTPFMALNAVWSEASWTAVTGVGPGAAEQLSVPFFYRMNTPVKILIEYGVFGLFFYLAVLIRAARTRRQAILLVPCLVLLMFTGGYHQFSPILFLFILVCDTAFLQHDAA